jgi:hypothetical protein
MTNRRWWRPRGGELRASIARILSLPFLREAAAMTDADRRAPSALGGPWWASRSPRRADGIGISLEIPRGRVIAWNLALLAIEGAAFAWAHALGWSWPVLGALAASLVALFVVFVVIVLPAYTKHRKRRHDLEVELCRAKTEFWRAHATVMPMLVAALHELREKERHTGSPAGSVLEPQRILALALATRTVESAAGPSNDRARA